MYIVDERIRKYSRIKYLLAIADIVYLLLILWLFQYSGLVLWLRIALGNIFLNPALLVFSYSFTLFLLYFILKLPVEFYHSYSLEHRFGLSNQKASAWIIDQLKELLVGFLIFIILVGGFFYFLRRFPDSWWWISSIFWIFFSVILARVFPVLIIPLFFKYKRIEDEELRQRIFNLAGKIGMNILDVYQIDFSKKTTKANAALVGLGKSKRVVLTDTLKGKFHPEEIEVILAHEFAHYKLRHIMKMLLLNCTVTLLVFYALFKYADLVFGRLGLSSADISSLAAWLFCFAILQISLAPLLNWISRIMERNADYLAVKLTGKTGAFISMMEKLSQQNLTEPKPPLWAKILFFDHPPVQERIRMAQGIKD